MAQLFSSYCVCMSRKGPVVGHGMLDFVRIDIIGRVVTCMLQDGPARAKKTKIK